MREMGRKGMDKTGRPAFAAVSAAATTLAICASLAGAPLLLGGCSSGGTYSVGGEGVNAARTFYGPDVTATATNGATVTVGRAYANMRGGIPEEIGIELVEGVLDVLPDPAFDEPGVYVAVLPQQAFGAVPFRAFVISDWSGHSPNGIGDVPHVHPVALLQPRQPAAPPFTIERVPVAAEEVPAGYVPAFQIPAVGNGTLAPGIGQGFEYPAAPQLQPGWNTIATNYFFYNGHMNGIGMGATYDFLESRQSASLAIAQPQVYPRPGYYPTRNSVRYDAQRGVHVFVLSDFVQAQRTL